MVSDHFSPFAGKKSHKTKQTPHEQYYHRVMAFVSQLQPEAALCHLSNLQVQPYFYVSCYLASTDLEDLIKGRFTSSPHYKVG